MANWRKILSHRIQTYNSHIWLWDRAGGVAVKVPVPHRPWNGLNPDFTHWMGVGVDESPDFIPNGPAGFADASTYVASGETTTSTTILAETVEELMKSLKAAGVVDDDDDDEDDLVTFADYDDDYYDDDDDF